jgi:Ca-activated chloride channel homolog
MIFARPWVLAFLAIPILLGFWEWWRRGRAVRMPFDHTGVKSRNQLERLVKLGNLLNPLLVALAVLFLAGPQRLQMPEAEREIKNVQFCIDMSGSMTAPYGDGQRHDQALKAMDQFCTYRKSGAFGLSVFGNEVIHWVPLTRDLSALRLCVPIIQPSIFPGWFGGTAIGKAMRSVLRRLTDVQTGDRMIILISDGESGDLGGGAAEQIGAELAAEKITLFYIHMGEGGPQQEVVSMVNLSGGEAFVAGDPSSLASVFAKIDSMSPAKLKPPTPEPVDNFQLLSQIGLGLLGCWMLCGLGLRFTPW